MPDVVKFVRQLAHDLRNHLNAAELQSAYLIEIAEDAEVEGRDQTSARNDLRGGRESAKLTAALSQPRLTEMPYDAAGFRGGSAAEIGHRSSGRKRENRMERLRRETPRSQIDPQLLLPALSWNCSRTPSGTSRGEGVISVEARDWRTIVSSSRSANRSAASSARPKTGAASHFARSARAIMVLASIGPELSSRRTRAAERPL